MTWTCPNCSRTFKNTNQWHSCARVEPELHLRNKSPRVRATYDKLIAELKKIGNFSLDAVKTSIQVKRKSTFVSIQPKRDHIEMAFQLGRKADEFPVYKTVRISGNRVLHYAVLEDPDDVDGRLMSWLRESYDLDT